ncbi:MAG TPA: heavy metal translocating P-type ATPase [Streptosporangiaceae bacterium]|nr:heavy metal translocating P-type ATPase [Streptosporangiaceae bacterium]
MGPETATHQPIELAVGGMTCASCAARIERRLNLLDGVEASVNYATETAYITQTGGRDVSELVSAIEAAGYAASASAPASGEVDEEARKATRLLAVRLIICCPLAVVVIVLAMVPTAQFTGWQWVSLVLTLPVAIWGAWPLHRAAWRGLQHGTATMDTLVSLGIAASLVWSVQAMFIGTAGLLGMRMPFALTFGPVGQGTIYFDVTAGVTASVLAGRYLESRAKRQSGSALTALAHLAARTVSVLRDGVERRESVTRLAVGDHFVTRPGEKIATDGLVIEGNSAVDGSLLTGESQPVEVGPGDTVTGATMNMSGRLVVRATRIGRDTQLSQIIRLVTEAQATKSGAQLHADRVAGVFVPCVIALAIATAGFWLGAGVPAQSALSAAFAVLVVACPCAMGLATSTALLAGVGRGAELGILIRGAHALESAHAIRVVVLDKTGTVTTGAMSLRAITGIPGSDENEILRLAGAVEDASEHPLGQAIAREASAKLGVLPRVTRFTSLAGAGVQGTVDGHDVVVGSPRLFGERSLDVPPSIARATDHAEESGGTAVLVAWDGVARGALCVADALKPGSVGGLARLHELGLRAVLLTGDNRRTALLVAAQLGIAAEDVFAGVTPDGKVEVIRSLQAAGAAVAAVGDGINDAAALAQADLGIAVGTGTDAAIGAADITLVGGDPRAIADALLLARATLRTIRQNLAWAFAYNIIALPIAALGYLNPLFAGLAMSMSSLIVVTNGLRLRRFHTSHPADATGLPTGAPTLAPAGQAS